MICGRSIGRAVAAPYNSKNMKTAPGIVLRPVAAILMVSKAQKAGIMKKFQLGAGAVQNKIERDKRSGYPAARRHELGTCAGEAGLCCNCYEEERKELEAWARQQPQPIATETPSGYWRRIGGPFLDAWYAVSWSLICEVRNRGLE